LLGVAKLPKGSLSTCKRSASAKMSECLLPSDLHIDWFGYLLSASLTQWRFFISDGDFAAHSLLHGSPNLPGENLMAEKQGHDGKRLSTATYRHEFAVHDGIVILEPFRLTSRSISEIVDF